METTSTSPVIVDKEILMSADFSVTKTETFDVEFAQEIVRNLNISTDERLALKRYLKNRKKGNKHDTTYVLGKKCKNEFLGRFCALRGEGLQGLSRDIRNAISKQYYHDLDMINAQPSILLQYAENNGWKCDAIKRYVEQREELLQELCDELDIERWEAKDRVIAIFFGCGTNAIQGMTRFFVDELYPEIRKIMENNWNANMDKLAWLNKQPNRVGKAMAYILQTEERTCLLAMDKSLTKHGRSLDVLIHDGGLVLKRDGETTLSSSLIREVEKDIKRDTGYSISLKVKTMETSFEKNDIQEDNYLEKKQEWEETGWKRATYFKIRNPASFGMVVDNAVISISKAELLQNEEDNKCSDGTLFIKRWLEDADKREYDRLVYLPKKEAPPNCYNIFTGYAVEPKAGADISIIHNLLRIIANNDEKMFDYIEKWVAHIIQKPYSKTGTTLVVIGKQGVGKDTYFNFIGKLLGNKCFFNTSSPENDVFARFNAGTEQTLLLKFEEANFKTNKANANALKSIITSHTQNIENKGQKKIVLDSFINIVMTTNNDIPVELEGDERRFVITRASDEKKGDYEFWKLIHGEMNKPEVQSAYLHYLENIDISKFVPERDRVLNESYDEVRQSFIPHLARWFQSEIEKLHEEQDFKEWKARDLFNEYKDSSYSPKTFELTETKLGRDMKQYIADGVIEKKRLEFGNKYVTNPQKLRAYLQEKGQWTDF